MAVPPAEKRSHERRPVQVRGYLQASGTSPLDCFWWWCLVRDLSPDGCRIQTQRPLDPGTPLALDLSVPGSPTSCTLHARVVHCAAEGGKDYRVGCRFLRALTPTELAALDAVAAQHKGVWVQPASSSAATPAVQ